MRGLSFDILRDKLSLNNNESVSIQTKKVWENEWIIAVGLVIKVRIYSNSDATASYIE